MGSDPLREQRGRRAAGAGGGTRSGAASSRVPTGGPAKRAGAQGVSDPRAARARELHRQAAEVDAQAARLREERNRLIHQLRAEDPARWSYGAIAAALGCSRELVALVLRTGRAG